MFWMEEKTQYFVQRIKEKNLTTILRDKLATVILTNFVERGFTRKMSLSVSQHPMEETENRSCTLLKF